MNIFREICRDVSAEPNGGYLDSESRIRELEFQLEKVTLATGAMWALVRGRLGLSKDELADRMRELDLMERRSAQRPDTLSHPVEVTCGVCGHTFQTCRGWCLYCGSELASAQTEA